jgi:hypothetical protein
MPWVRARNFQKGSRGNLGELEVAQVYGAIGAAGVAANQMKTATFISLIFWFLVIFDQKHKKLIKVNMFEMLSLWPQLSSTTLAGFRLQIASNISWFQCEMRENAHFLHKLQK